MLIRVFIGLVIFVCITVLAGRAYASCVIIDEAMGILSDVRNTQLSENASISLDRLNSVTLLGSDFAAAHPSQAERFSTFMKRLNDVDNLNSASITNNEIQNFIGALQVMERFWNCVEPEEISPVEVFGQSGSMTSESEVKFSNETDRISPETAVSGRSDNRALAQNSGDLRPARISKPNKLQVNYSVLIGMILLFVGGMTYVVRKRPKPREARRIINVPIRVELAKNVIEMRIVDITVNGCKIEHADRIRGHKKLKIELSGAWYSGQIKWRNSAFAGVKFQRPLTEGTFKGVVKEAFV